MKKIAFSLLLAGSVYHSVHAQKWQYQSSAFGDIPLTWKAKQQTALLPLDVNKDGVQEVILGNRTAAPALIYLQYDRGIGWREFVLEKDAFPIDAGGAAYDIDRDGDLDIVFGGDGQSNGLWWWENPYPYFNPSVPWRRYVIKDSGANQEHDQVFGDFKQTGTPQLAYWNQGDRTLYLSEIPPRPKDGTWPAVKVFTSENTEPRFLTGCDAADVDGDGYTDLIAGNHWFKYQPETQQFKAIKIGEESGRIKAAKFKPGKRMQFVVSSGDGRGRLTYYECNGNAEVSENWKGKDLIGREWAYGHTLDVADVDNDGNLDILSAEMMQRSENKVENPNAEAVILYGDGNGNFRKTLLQRGIELHEGRLMDIDGDGDQDVVSKSALNGTPRVDMWLQNGTGEAVTKINKVLNGRIGLELYSLRDYLKTDVPATLKYTKDLGITEVEVAGFPNDMTYESIKTALDNAGLQPKSALFGFEDFQGEKIETIIQKAKILGVRYVGCAWIPHRPNQFGQAEADKAIAVFNAAGERLAKAGIHFFYHCHGYEFKPQAAGGTLFDYIVEKTNSANVSYECDVYWAFHGGQDPALLLRKHAGRFVALHLKDMAYGQATGELSGGTPLTSDVALGTGQLDFQPILRAGIETGVKFYFIEDENADVKQHLPVTLRYLNGLR